MNVAGSTTRRHIVDGGGVDESSAMARFIADGNTDHGRTVRRSVVAAFELMVPTG